MVLITTTYMNNNILNNIVGAEFVKLNFFIVDPSWVRTRGGARTIE